MIAVTVSALTVAGCGSDDSASKSASTSADKSRTLTIYSGREEELVAPLYETFEEQTGIKLNVKYAESPAIAALLKEEGAKTPADVFYAQDAGSVGAVSDQLAELPQASLDTVRSEHRDPDSRWVGVTGRVRTLVYNTDELSESDLPQSVNDLTDAKWKGKLGIAPTNSSFEAFVSGMRIVDGDKKARAFLDGLTENDAREYPKNGAIVDAVASGEIQAGLVNHYYLYEKLAKDPKAPIANHFFSSGDIGNMVNVSAVGILKSAQNEDEAREFVDFMLTEGQSYIVEDAPEREYPLATDFNTESERYKELKSLDDVGAPEVDLAQLSEELAATVAMITEAGLRS
jgi:iron(III) transport system substrate-binding protein